MPALYKAAWDQIQRFEDMDHEQRVAYRDGRLRRILKAAGYGPGVALDALPFISKADVRADPQRFRHWTLVPPSRAFTSGTNGEPMEVSRCIGSVVFEQAAIDWVVSRGGFDFVRDRVAVLRATTILGLSRGEKVGRLLDGGRVLELPANDLSDETFPAFLTALQGFAPKIMYVMPSAAEYLAELMIERRVTLEIPLIVASSEVLTAAARRKFAVVFGARSIDHYGQSERVCAAYSTEPGQFRFIGSYGVAEFVRSGDDWELAGTGLHNTAQPLVRYRTGDLLAGDLAAGDVDKISLGLLPFGGIEGRRADALIGRDGRRSVAMNYVPRGLEEYGRFQFIQERPHQVTIQVAGWSPRVKDRPEPIVRRARLMVPEDFDVSVRFVDKLERTAAGKTPFIIRRF
jgi:phenylacetate-CoA ligase